jgi:integrase
LNAIKKGNKVLPKDQQIPHWSPYLLRNSAATAIELEHGLDEAQAQLGHTSANMTKRYSKAQLKQREKLAHSRVNPFEK